MTLEYKVVYQYSNDPELRQHSETVYAVDPIDAMNKVETAVSYTHLTLPTIRLV